MESSFVPKDYGFRMLTKNGPNTKREERRERVDTKFFRQSRQSERFREEP
jgi:hypothetical protein